MPVNLLSIAVAWLATHLVVISLFGFLLAGLFVFGVIDTPVSLGTKQTVSAPQRPRADGVPPDTDLSAPSKAGLEAPSDKPDPAGKVITGDVDAAEGPASRGPERLPPRLIGGSLPVYEQQGAGFSGPGSTPGSAGGAFRPPGEDPGLGPLSMTREDHLQQARRAFWNGEFETAEAVYMALISEYPADADVFGELGNLYQSMGKPARALDAYYEAAVRLKAAGEHDKLKEVIELLTREGDPRVDQLAP